MCGWSIDREAPMWRLARGPIPGCPPRDVVTLVHTLSGQPCSRPAGGGIPVRQLTRITWIVHAGPVGAVNVSVPSASVVRVCCWAV
jgi:hypothetical protein